jgi:hypothetical protein
VKAEDALIRGLPLGHHFRRSLSFGNPSTLVREQRSEFIATPYGRREFIAIHDELNDQTSPTWYEAVRADEPRSQHLAGFQTHYEGVNMPSGSINHSSQRDVQRHMAQGNSSQATGTRWPEHGTPAAHVHSHAHCLSWVAIHFPRSGETL